MTKTGADGQAVDDSPVRVVVAFVLDVIGHNRDRDPNVFQIAPCEGVAAAWLAGRPHRANLAGNRLAAQWNRGSVKSRFA